MSLKSSNQVEKNRCQLEIEIAGDVFEKAINDVYRKQGKKIMIPGFRKGKAPRAFIEKYYGDQVFYEDAINALYPAALEEAVKEAKIEMIEDKIDFDLVSAGKDGLVFKVTVTTKPEITLGSYKGIQAEKIVKVITDDDVMNEIKKVQDRNSRMVTVEDRNAENGDITVIDFEGFVDGTAFEGGKGENFSLTLGSGQFIPGFEDQVVGHKTGDEFDVNVTFPEDYQAKDLAGKAAVFKVKLHEIKVKELPELDDDFVKDVSDFDTLDSYKEDVRAKLTEAAGKRAQDDLENKLIDKLVEMVEGDIPEAMYNNKINEDLRDFAYRLQSQGLNMETYMKYTGMTQDAMRESMRPQAERQVKIRLALEKIAQLENIVPSDEDIEQEYQTLAENYGMEADKIKGLIAKEDLAKDVSVKKAIDLVKESAEITEKAE